MSDYTLHRFTIDFQHGKEEFTSVVCSEGAFDKLLELMRDAPRAIDPQVNKRIDDAVIDTYKAKRYIPFIAKGTITKWIFEHFGVETKLMAIVVRGYGPSMTEDTLKRFSD